MSISGDIAPPARSRAAALLGSSLGKFSADVVYAALSQVLGRGSLILASILVANLMTTESFAAFTYFNLTITAIAAFSTLGLGTAAARTFAEAGESLGIEAKARMLTVLFLAAGCSVLAALLVLIAPEAWLAGSVQVDRPLLACAVCLVTFNTVALGALSGRGAFDMLALAAVLGTLMLLSGVAVAALMQSTTLALFAIVLSLAVQFAVYLIVLRPLLSGEPRTLPSVQDMTSALSVAGPMFATSLIVAGIFWVLGRVALQADNGIAEFSGYAVGLQWFSLTLLIPSIVTRVFFPRIVRAANEHTAGRPLILANAGANLVISAGIGAVVLLAGDMLLALYGNQDIAQTAALHWFILSAIIASPVNGLGNAIIARDPGPRHWLTLKTIWCLIALATALYGQTELTAASAGFALFVAYCCLVPMSLVVLRLQKLI